MIDSQNQHRFRQKNIFYFVLFSRELPLGPPLSFSRFAIICIIIVAFNHRFDWSMEFIQKLFPWCCGVDSPPPNTNQKPTTNRNIRTHPKDQSITSTPLPIPPPSPLSIGKMQDSMGCLDLSRLQRKDQYQGEEISGIPNGNGFMLYANGDFYRGEWVNGKKEGRGLQIYHELGLQYEGQWQNDKHHGTGKLTQQNASSYYFGQFKNGLKHGKGQYFNLIKNKQYNEVYEKGELKQQKEIVIQKNIQSEYVTLNLDKQRFNTMDLEQFQQANPEAIELSVFFLLKYYGLCKLTNLSFIAKNIRQWSIKQVLQLLEAINLKNCKQVFYMNKIKGKDLFAIKEQELKNDLKMMIGERKRLLNYIRFIKEFDEKYAQLKKFDKKARNKQRYRLHSANLMNNVLKSIKTGVYKDSIQQQSLQSQKDSRDFLQKKKQQTSEKQDSQMKIPTPDECKYGSAAEQIQVHSENKQQTFSLQLVWPKSERSQSKSSKSRRKNSKDNDQMVQGYIPIIFNKTHQNISHDLQNADQTQRYSQKLEPAKPSHFCHDNQIQNSSSSQEQVIKPQLIRKKTFEKTHLNLQSSQIRELYDFLKVHRSLSFIIKEKDIVNIEYIGEGGYGKVYKGKYVCQQIAIKDYIKTGKHHHKQDFMKELQIISDLKHPNIVLYMGICITANKYTLITEYLQNGSLFDQLHKKKKKFTEAEQMSIAYDIVKGMVYLHNMKKILHRDLKSSNVLIGENWQVKLCDFGLSGQKKNSLKKKKGRVGTYQWMAPQVMRNEEKIDQYADVYSFGVIIWELLSEKIPYSGLTEQQIVGLIGYDHDYQFQQPKGSPFLKFIMRKCLNRDPNLRPTFIQIQNEFDQEYNKLESGFSLTQYKN